MRTSAYFVLLVSLILLSTARAGWWSGDDHQHDHREYLEDLDEELSYVTYGSVIKLAHKGTGYRLHSHEVNYGGGSRQQSVTCYPDGTDSNSYWIVKEAFGERPQAQGTRIKHGDKVRFQHMMTGRNLHTHSHTAPLSQPGYEVSCYGGEDVMDNWVVDIPEKGFWKRGEYIRLKNAEMNTYLMSHSQVYPSPIQGQHEVKCVTRKNDDAFWYTEEGLYFESSDVGQEETN